MPKVPRHYQDVVPEEFWEQSPMHLLEKVDGANLRIFIYDRRYQKLYPDDEIVREADHGDVVFGLKNSIQGVVGDDRCHVQDDIFNMLVEFILGRNLSDSLLKLHDRFDSPLILFCEYMIEHSLRYDWESTPPVLGYDIYKQSEWEEPPSNPYEEDFRGFLSWSQAKQAFSVSDIPTVPEATQAIESTDEINPEEIEVPQSSLREGVAEGIVFRTPRLDHRVKLVSSDFEERNREVWGLREEQAQTGAELFKARYLTRQRIEKQINSLLLAGSLPSTPEDAASEITEHAVVDAWTEEIHDIKSKFTQGSTPDINPSEVPELVEPQAKKMYLRMKRNAERNETKPRHIWQNINQPKQETISSLNQNPYSEWKNRSSKLRERVQQSRSPEYSLVSALLSEETLSELFWQIDSARQIQKSYIPDLIKKATYHVFIDNCEVIATLDTEIDLRKINEESTRKAREWVNENTN